MSIPPLLPKMGYYLLVFKIQITHKVESKDHLRVSYVFHKGYYMRKISQ